MRPTNAIGSPGDPSRTRISLAATRRSSKTLDGDRSTRWPKMFLSQDSPSSPSLRRPHVPLIEPMHQLPQLLLEIPSSLAMVLKIPSPKAIVLDILSSLARKRKAVKPASCHVYRPCPPESAQGHTAINAPGPIANCVRPCSICLKKLSRMAGTSLTNGHGRPAYLLITWTVSELRYTTYLKA